MWIIVSHLFHLACGARKEGGMTQCYFTLILLWYDSDTFHTQSVYIVQRWYSLMADMISNTGDAKSSKESFKTLTFRNTLFYGDVVYKLRMVKDTPNFSSGSKLVKRLRRRQYDPVLIERTICLVLGPSTALYIPFLKHCTLTNKAVWTIWRALSKPPQRRQGPDLSPLWLLVGILQPSDLSSLSAGRSIAYPIRMPLYIFLLYYIYHICFTCIDFYDLFAWGGCWFVVYIRRFIYKL